jgi:arsenate reductase
LHFGGAQVKIVIDKENDMVKIYGIKACDTCRKAMKALGAELHDVRATPLSSNDLGRFYAAFGEALVNTRSTTWRALDADERSRDHLELLADHPTLMKRPVIDQEGTLYLGWGAEVQSALLSS